jgi:hypothetical protein
VADDIVNDLRFHIGAVQSSWDVTLYMRAADEIERLQAAGDGLVAALKDARSAMCDYAHQGTGTDPESPEWEDFCMTTWEGVPNDLAAVDAAITAWEEARRG